MKAWLCSCCAFLNFLLCTQLSVLENGLVSDFMAFHIHLPGLTVGYRGRSSAYSTAKFKPAESGTRSVGGVICNQLGFSLLHAIGRLASAAAGIPADMRAEQQLFMEPMYTFCGASPNRAELIFKSLICCFKSVILRANTIVVGFSLRHGCHVALTGIHQGTGGFDPFSFHSFPFLTDG